MAVVVGASSLQEIPRRRREQLADVTACHQATW